MAVLVALVQPKVAYSMHVGIISTWWDGMKRGYQPLRENLAQLLRWAMSMTVVYLSGRHKMPEQY